LLVPNELAHLEASRRKVNPMAITISITYVTDAINAIASTLSRLLYRRVTVHAVHVSTSFRLM